MSDKKSAYLDIKICATTAKAKPKRKPKRKKQNPAHNLPVPDEKDPTWSEEMIQKHQRQDPVLSIVIDWLLKYDNRPEWGDMEPRTRELKYWWTRWDSLVVYECGTLRFEWRDCKHKHKSRIVLPETLQPYALRVWHNSDQGGHLGSNKTWGRAKNSVFFWRDMRTSVRNHVRTCITCARCKPSGHGKQHELEQNYIIDGKFSMVGMDLVGPLPLTKDKNKYILMVVDYFTKWAEAIPIQNKEAATVARGLHAGWITKKGTPERILSDQGKEFDNKLFHELCKLMESQKVRTTAFHPQTNGLCERLNQTIERMLRAVVKDSQTDWDIQLANVMMAYNSSPQESTGLSPHMLMFGDEMPVPLDWVFGQPRHVPQDKVVYVRDLRSRIQAAYEQARKALMVAAKRQKRNYDPKVRNIQFSPGDIVMCHTKSRTKGRNPALTRKWLGPFVIMRMPNPATAKIQESAKDTGKIVHVDRLKHFFPEDVSQYQWALPQLKADFPSLKFDTLEGLHQGHESPAGELNELSDIPVQAWENTLSEGGTDSLMDGEAHTSCAEQEGPEITVIKDTPAGGGADPLLEDARGTSVAQHDRASSAPIDNENVLVVDTLPEGRVDPLVDGAHDTSVEQNLGADTYEHHAQLQYDTHQDDTQAHINTDREPAVVVIKEPYDLKSLLGDSPSISLEVPIPKRRIPSSEIRKVREACVLPHMREWECMGGVDPDLAMVFPSSWDSAIHSDSTGEAEPLNLLSDSSLPDIESEEGEKTAAAYDPTVDNDYYSEGSEQRATKLGDRCCDDDVRPFTLPPRRKESPPAVRTRAGRATRAPARFRDFVCNMRTRSPSP